MTCHECVYGHLVNPNCITCCNTYKGSAKTNNLKKKSMNKNGQYKSIQIQTKDKEFKEIYLF